MRKMKCFFLLWLLLILLGCQAVELNHASMQQSENNELLLDEQIVKITISEIGGAGETVLQDVDSIASIRSIVNSAVKEDGIVNIIEPDFYMNLLYEHGVEESFYCWIGDSGMINTLMRTEDTHTIYTPFEETPVTLLEFFQ
ncbi:hypothetical protein [Sporosarcina sp. USHLN248]|uniref:hypothetical protein n=1 Tax=Sporosarcina sp. USHLN248 TaxID=3081300 RepID=UPI00301A8EEC